MPLSHDGAAPEADLVSTLVARLAAIETIVQTTTELVDEKTLKELRRTVEALSKRDPKFEERVTNKVDVLADRIEHVAKTVSTSSAALAAKDGEIVQLRRELEGSLQRMNGAIAQAGRGADPAALAEMRRELDELSKVTRQRMPRGLEGRIEELSAKVDLVAQRVDSVSSTISTTAAGLAGRDGETNALRRAFEAESDRITAELAELRRGVDPTAMADARQALKEFADETSRRQHAVHNQLGQTGARVDALAEKVDAVANALTKATSRVAATEEGLSAFRTYFEEAGGKLSAVLTEHNRSLAALSTRTAALEQAGAAEAGAYEERLVEVNARLDRAAERLVTLEQSRDEAAQFLDRKVSAAVDASHDLAARLEPLAADVAATKERMSARDAAIDEVELRFQDASSRVDALVADLSRALAELPDPDQVERVLTARIDEIAGQASTVSDEFAQVKASVSGGLEASAAASGELARFRAEHREALDELAGHVGSLTDVVESTASSVSGLSEELSAIRARTRALEEAGGQAHELETQLASTTRKLDALARELEASATESFSTAARVSGAEEEVSALRDYVERAGSRLSSLIAEHTRSLAALDTRAASLEQFDAGALSGLAQENAELEVKIEELAAKFRSAEDDRAENASEIARVAAILEVERAALRAKMEALAGAAETAAAPETEELEQRVAALGARVEALDDERSSSQAQFEAIAKALASIPQRSTLEQRLDDLGRRMDDVEQRSAAVATKVSNASALLPTALRSLEARLDEVSPGSRAAMAEPDDPSERPGRHDEKPEAVRAAESEHVTASVLPLRVNDT